MLGVESARSEESESNDNLKVMLDLSKGQSLVWCKKVEGIPGIYM